MNLFFEESGHLKAAKTLLQQGESWQITLPTGKRAKVRAKDVLFEFSTPTPECLLEDAQQLAKSIDVHFLWEVAGTDTFHFNHLGMEYFGHTPSATEAAGLLFCLHGAPIYFHRKGKGCYKGASQEALKAALVGMEKKKQQAQRVAAWVKELKAARLPETFQAQMPQLFLKPDKNSLEYKAIHAVCQELSCSPERLMLSVGVLSCAKAWHLERFLLDFFPKGRHFPADLNIETPIATFDDLPLASVQAFSIDDVTTTEIDDAFSVTRQAYGTVRIGIHIAAPGLYVQAHDSLDAIARTRMSTVYMPGDKITMLPPLLIESFSLDAGFVRPALSLYATLDAAGQLMQTETHIERVPIISNLRHNDWDTQTIEEDMPHRADILYLWQWANVLEKARQAQRQIFGLLPEQEHRINFNFYIDNADHVTITPQKRGSPLDKIVAELMIFTNSIWGKLIAEHGLPGIYRAQSRNTTGKLQVKLQTCAAPHQGLGVHQYAWSTSPLRRYVDLVNQWQILSCVKHGVAARLVAAFKPHDTELHEIILLFEMTYASYSEFQTRIERYWCLRWLSQQAALQQTTSSFPLQFNATVLRSSLCRLIDIPLIINVVLPSTIARGAQIRLAILDWDELDLSVNARLLGVMTTSQTTQERVEESEDINERAKKELNEP